MINAINSALTGLQSATRQVDKSAERIANFDGGGVDLAEEIVNMKLAEAQFKASVSVLQAQQENERELARLFDETV